MIKEEIKEEGFSISRENDPGAKTIVVKPGIISRLNRKYDCLPTLIQLLILLIFVGSQMIFTSFLGNVGYIYWSVLLLLLTLFRIIPFFR